MSGEKTPWDIPLIRVAAKKGAYWYHGWGKNWTKPHGIRKKNRWSNMQKDVWVRYLAGWFEPLELNHNQTNKKANPAPWDNRPRGRRDSCQSCIWCHSNSILLGFLWMRQIASVQSSKSSSKTIRDVGLTMFVWRLSSIYLNDKLPQKVCGSKFM